MRKSKKTFRFSIGEHTVINNFFIKSKHAISVKEFEKKIEHTLISAYKRIRSNVRNGLAIVPIERNASGGSYFTIPPQVQMEIASRQKIITDEYSGRILVDPKLAEEEMDKMKSIFS